MVNRALPRGGVMPGLVLESRARMQGANMSARVTFLTAILLATLVFVCVNAAVDLLYAMIDPRVRVA